MTPANGPRLVDVDGCRIWAQVQGRGPSVVLINGAGAPGVDGWAGVDRDLATFARVTSYDRPGLGRSDPAPARPTLAAMVADLRGVLAALGVGGPHVLVGASLGALVQLRFALDHPSEVAGQVVV